MQSFKNVVDEFEGLDLGDNRLNQRFLKLIQQLSQKAGDSIQLACEDWGSVKAAYRFFSNPQVSPEAIIAPHLRSTERRISQIADPYILVAHDTTFFNYTHHPATQGLCEIAKSGLGNFLQVRGLIMHAALAVTTDGLPLGLLGQKLWSRTQPIGLHHLSGKNHTRVSIKEKESYKWIEVLEQAIRGTRHPERLVHVADREADIYELFERVLGGRDPYRLPKR